MTSSLMAFFCTDTALENALLHCYKEEELGDELCLAPSWLSLDKDTPRKEKRGSERRYTIVAVKKGFFKSLHKIFANFSFSQKEPTQHDCFFSDAALTIA